MEYDLYAFMILDGLCCALTVMSLEWWWVYEASLNGRKLQLFSGESIKNWLLIFMKDNFK